ncbi:MAG TPA: UrcA family protein [Caulobacteraceae bacterium]|nr:UrcA family protein [Caulobacteraceae bacterium]
MKPFTFRYVAMGAASVAAVALGLAAAGGPARAQDDYYAGSYAPPADVYNMGELIVRAPRVIGRSPTTGAPIVLTSETRVVHTGDLDLSTPWGAHVARLRIERVAREACDDLDTPGRVPLDSSTDCYRDTTRRAMYDAEVALGFTPPTWQYLG